MKRNNESVANEKRRKAWQAAAWQRWHQRRSEEM